MTLNITYADQAGIYQSSDHRLTWNNGTWSDSAYKHLSISNGLSDPAWFASLTYTGIGRFDDIDLARWLAHHLTARGVHGRTLDDVAEIVRSECERRARRVPKDNRLTLTLAGFSRGEARVFLISNFQSVEPRTRILQSQTRSSAIFRAEEVRADGRLLITGAEAALSRKNRRELARILRKLAGEKQNTIAIFEALAAANDRAANSGLPGANGISSSCMCYAMLPDGTSSSVLYGSGMQPSYMPPSVMGDVDVGELVARVIADLQQSGAFGPTAQANQIALAEAERQAIRRDPAAAVIRERVVHSVGTAVGRGSAAAGRHEAYVPHLTGRVTIVDTTKLAVKDVVLIGAPATGSTVHPGGDRVYITANAQQPGAGRSMLVVIETANRSVQRFELGNAINSVIVHPSGELIYVADSFGECVYVVDRTGATVLDVIVVPGTPSGMALTRTGRWLYVACVQANIVTQIDSTSNTVVSTFQSEQNPFAVDVSPDEARIFVSNSSSNSVSMIDRATRRRIDLPVMRQPRAAALAPSGQLWYVANSSSAHVSVIETSTFTVVARVPVGSQPNGIAVEPDGARVFVTNGDSGTVSVIDTGTNRVIATVSVEEQPMAVGRFVH